jgi:hypothetical protein
MFLLEFNRHHADLGGKVDNRAIDVRVRLAGAHHFGGVVYPDLVGEVQCQKPLGPTRGFHQVAGKQGRCVGREDRFLRRQMSDLAVDISLELNVLGNSLDH